MDDNTKSVLMELVQTIRGALALYLIQIGPNEDGFKEALNRALWAMGRDAQEEGR